MPTARIVVPTYENADTIRAVVEAAARQAPVTVVDDASADGTAAIAREAGARVLAVDRRSVAHARNVGARDATEDLVLFLDSDAIPAEDWVAVLAERFARGDADIVGGDVLSTPTTRVGRAYDRMYRALDAKLFGDGSVMLPGMNLGVRREMFERVAFDDALPGALCEDVDFLVRAKAAGARIAFEPRAIVLHRHPQRLREIVAQEVRHGRGRALLLAKHPDRAGDASVRSWPAWAFDVTFRAPWHVAHAYRAAGADFGVCALHWLRMAAGNWGYLKARRAPPQA